MLYYDRIDFSEGIDVNKTSASKECKKQKFHQHKRPILIKNVDVNKVVVSYKISFGKKYLTISLATKVLKNLCIFLSKLSG